MVQEKDAIITGSIASWEIRAEGISGLVGGRTLGGSSVRFFEIFDAFQSLEVLFG